MLDQGAAAVKSAMWPAREVINPGHLKTLWLCLTAQVGHAARADEGWVAEREVANPTRGDIYFEPAEDDQGRALGLLQNVVDW